MGLVGIANANVCKTKPIFTGLGNSTDFQQFVQANREICEAVHFWPLRGESIVDKIPPTKGY